MTLAMVWQKSYMQTFKFTQKTNTDTFTWFSILMIEFNFENNSSKTQQPYVISFHILSSPLTVVMFQPPGSGSGVLTSESSLVPEEARAQAEHMVPTSLRSVITLILMFTYSEFGASQFTSGIISTLVNISSALSSLYTLYYSVTFSDVEHWKVSSIISIGSSEMFSTLTEEVLSGICEYHQ